MCFRFKYHNYHEQEQSGSTALILKILHLVSENKIVTNVYCRSLPFIKWMMKMHHSTIYGRFARSQAWRQFNLRQTPFYDEPIAVVLQGCTLIWTAKSRAKLQSVKWYASMKEALDILVDFYSKSLEESNLTRITKSIL